jgi:hypothetical protein
MEPSRPTDQAIEALESMIGRRMSNTGETREEACDHLITYIENYIHQLKND